MSIDQEEFRELRGAVSQIIRELGAIGEALQTIKEQMPRVAKDARDAYESSLELRAQWDELKKPHECRYQDKITTHEVRLLSLRNWGKILIAAIIPLLFAVCGAAGKAVYDSATLTSAVSRNTSDIEELKENHREVFPIKRYTDSDAGKTSGIRR